MSSLSDRLDDYAALPPDERAAATRDAAASPEHAEQFAEARALAALLDAAAAARPGRPVSEDDLAAFLADQALGLVPSDAVRVEAALAADPGLRDAADRMRSRLANLDAHAAGAESAEAQFERLFGHTLPSPAAAAPAAPPPSETPRSAHRNGEARHAARPSADRAAAPPPRAARSGTGRRVLVLAAALLVAYGGLAAVSASQQTDRARLADLSDLASYAPIETRGADADPLAARLDTALDGVAGARRTTLGLFPRFDSARLDAVAVDLADISSAADPASSVSQEARFALARVRLHQSRDGEAVRLLAALVSEQSYRSAEARRLLDAIRTAPGA